MSWAIGHLPGLSFFLSYAVLYFHIPGSSQPIYQRDPPAHPQTFSNSHASSWEQDGILSSPFNGTQNRKQELQGGTYVIIAMMDYSHHLPNSHMRLLQGLFSISHGLHIFYFIYSSQQHVRSVLSLSESEVSQSYSTLCDPMACSLPGSVHGIFQARILEWVAISFSRGSSWPRDRALVSHIAGRHFTVWATREAQYYH